MQNKRRNGHAPNKTSVEDEIVHLRGLDLKGLRARWQSVLQRPAPGHLPRHLVARQSGWEHSDNQDGHFGGRGKRMIVAARR